jgi:hypothetical protein
MLMEFMLLNFLVHKFTFKSIFKKKKCQKEFFLGKDPDPVSEPDPDVFKGRIQICSKIVRISNTARNI